MIYISGLDKGHIYIVPKVTMGSERDYCLSKSGSHHGDKRFTIALL